MSIPTSSSALDEFAAVFIRDTAHHSQVRSEALAEALRARFGLPPFPSINELRKLCLDLGIPLWRLPDGITDTEAANFSVGSDVAILVSGDLRGPRLESSLAHEIREAIENAFQRVKPAYEGLPTHDNARMNPVSDRFAGYLLMETTASRALMWEVGFDLAEFARRTGRSLPSVVKRATQLFSSKSGVQAPVMGVWLFESPWEAVKAASARVDDLRVQHVAKLSGFTQQRGTLTRRVFPDPGDGGPDFTLVEMAVREGHPRSVMVGAMSTSESRDYLAVAEPIILWGVPWRVLVTAVRADGAHHVGALLARLKPTHGDDQLQHL